VPRVLAVLKPPKSHPNFLFYAKHIAESCAKSPYFPPPFAPLAPLEADIPALEAVKKMSAPAPRQDFQVDLGKKSGTVVLRRKAARGPTSYEWQYITDGKTWISLTPNV
jgi:hypothetical protein